MADLKKRAEEIRKRAEYHVAKHKYADMDDVVLPSKQRWPEFMPLVDKLKEQVVRTIQAEADKIESDMPYKQQAVLEILIHELQELV